jgi:3-hydroxybutyrate dehydrogenase
MAGTYGMEGRVAIVTGAAGGLGRAICADLGKEGVQILGVDIASGADTPDIFLADVGTESGNRDMVAEAVKRFGRIDTLVLNAATQFLSPIPDYPIEEWDRINDVIVRGAFLALKFAWTELTSRPGGRVIAVASTSSFVGQRYACAYIAAKHALLGLVRAAAVEAGPFEMTVNAVVPCLMMTGQVDKQMDERVRITGRSPGELVKEWCRGQAMERPVETAEVARVVTFLASRFSSGITGAAINTDLGYLSVRG